MCGSCQKWKHIPSVEIRWLEPVLLLPAIRVDESISLVQIARRAPIRAETADRAEVGALQMWSMRTHKHQTK